MRSLERTHKAETKTLQEKLREHFARRTSPAGETAKEKRCLLLDYSGSMYQDAGTGRSRTEELVRAIQGFSGERLFWFNHDCFEAFSFSDLPGMGRGSTAMHLAFDTIKSAGIEHAIIATDGKPDSESYALNSAKGLRLDILYIGPPPVPEFLRELAAATGGKFDVSDFKMQGQLTTQIKGLLAGS